MVENFLEKENIFVNTINGISDNIEDILTIQYDFVEELKELVIIMNDNNNLYRKMPFNLSRSFNDFIRRWGTYTYLHYSEDGGNRVYKNLYDDPITMEEFKHKYKRLYYEYGLIFYDSGYVTIFNGNKRSILIEHFINNIDSKYGNVIFLSHTHPKQEPVALFPILSDIHPIEEISILKGKLLNSEIILDNDYEKLQYPNNLLELNIPTNNIISSYYVDKTYWELVLKKSDTNYINSNLSTIDIDGMVVIDYADIGLPSMEDLSNSNTLQLPYIFSSIGGKFFTIFNKSKKVIYDLKYNLKIGYDFIISDNFLYYYKKYPNYLPKSTIYEILNLDGKNYYDLYGDFSFNEFDYLYPKPEVGEVNKEYIQKTLKTQDTDGRTIYQSFQFKRKT